MKTPDSALRQGDVTVEVSRASGTKCPRCWNYHTVQGNPMGCCDRCVLAVTAMLPELVGSGRWTEADAEEWRVLLRSMVAKWKT
jgi:hypothetical protein